MGSALEWAKVVGIGAIVALLGYQVVETFKPAVTPGTLPIEAPRSSSTEDADRAKQDLMRIVEAPLRGNFKFPDSVKVRWLKTEQTKLLSHAGLNVSQNDEIEEWKMCGVYSAPTPMGLYDPFEKFFARVSIAHSDKALGGEVYFMSDGSWHHIWELAGPLSTSADEKDLKKAGVDFCDGMNSVDKGVYKEYGLGFPRFGWYDDIVSYASDQKNKSFFDSCLAGKNTLRDCRVYHRCVINPEREKECEKGYQLCAAGEPVKQCADKIVAEFKRNAEKEAAEKKNKN